MSSHSFKFWLCNLSLFPFECARGYDDRRHSRIARAPSLFVVEKAHDREFVTMQFDACLFKVGHGSKNGKWPPPFASKSLFFLFQLEWLGERLWRRLHNINLSRCLWKEMKTRRTEKFHSKYFFTSTVFISFVWEIAASFREINWSVR